ncbi:MAG TPA: hypothetical protein VMU04_03010 [Candidatus Acidoferrum sp.]|nr:hypothetical protein [Candidatus Acidoferrum sp.]
MNRKYIRIDWLVPVAGAAIVLAGMIGAASYIGLERQVESSQTLAVTLDRLHADQTLSLALRKIQDGRVAEATRQLDVFLCDDVLQLDTQMAAADELTQAFVKDAFRRIARTRPAVQEPPAGAQASDVMSDQIAAQRVLALALVDRPGAAAKSPGM